MGIKTNWKSLVQLSVQGKVHGAQCAGYLVSPDGKAHIVPQIGGVTYNVKVGDRAFGWAADHVEPGASLQNDNKDDNMAFTALSCIGNEALVVSGDAKGARGVVVGKHLGIELKSNHVIVAFTDDVLEKLDVTDSVLVKAYGQGLCIEGFSDVAVSNIDPSLLDKLDIMEAGGKLEVPVAAKVPAALLGFKTGMEAYRGDFDIVSDDVALLEKHGLLGLRLGDLVLIEDFDCTYNRGFCTGATAVGLVVTGDAIPAGHGPGLINLLASRGGAIAGRLDASANISNYLGLAAGGAL